MLLNKFLMLVPKLLVGLKGRGDEEGSKEERGWDGEREVRGNNSFIF